MIKKIMPNSFQAEAHWYPRVLNATINPLVSFFYNLNQTRLVNRYCHLHPMVDQDALVDILAYQPKHFFWSGTDLINVTSAMGKRQMVVIETNSCPSGQKSSPLRDDHQEMGGYKLLVENTIKRFLKGKRLIKGALAMIYDKNPMEASGYAAAMSEIFNEPVYLVSYYDKAPNEHIRLEDGVVEIHVDGAWLPIRFAYRYLTQRPWNRLPIAGKTLIFNPIITCLAGGRNKLVAAKAYEILNSELKESGLKINMPVTMWDVSKQEVPLWVDKFNGHAVVKVPYSNAGQGVFTITSKSELDAFMELEIPYDQFIVQSLIGNYNWSSVTEQGKLYHVGTIPDKHGHTYVADLRFMMHYTSAGYQPVCIYGRRAMKPLPNILDKQSPSWDVLGTNLSIKLGENKWDSDVNRLIIMDRKDFNKLGLGLDDLIEAYIQSLMATIAIDKMSIKLLNQKGVLKRKLFKSLNKDDVLYNEIL